MYKLAMGIYTAVIIEPRVHAAWPIVLKNFLTHLDSRWDFLIFCGLRNEEYLKTLINADFAEHLHRITIINMNVDNLTINEYNRLMTSKDIYLQIPTEMFLIFQLDTLISSKYYDYIYDFIEYDYVGAPWQWTQDVGNGGLSLRRKSTILHIINNIKVFYNEDMYFSANIQNKPDIQKAMLFSVESIFSEKSFGIHQCWPHMTKEQINMIAEHIPEIYTLMQTYN